MEAPRTLYRYQPLSAYSLAALVNGTVWLAKPGTFNDPYDCSLTLASHSYSDSLRHAVSAALDKGLIEKPDRADLFEEYPGDRDAFEDFRASIRQLFQELGICCFGAIDNHLLMWSHYADHHRGFCVEYANEEGTMLRRLAHPVRYSDSMLNLSAADFAPAQSAETLEALWLTKASCWSYEQEWRMAMPEGNKSYQAPAPVRSVIFGARMSHSDRVTIKYALRHEPDIIFKEAVLQENRFTIEITPFLANRSKA